MVMSHKWTANAFATMADNVMKAVKKAVQEGLWVISHDNVNLPVRVFSQRLDHKDLFLNGTAATIWSLPASSKRILPPDANTRLKQQMMDGAKEPFSFTKEIIDGDPAAKASVRSHMIHRILRFLLEAPQFADYQEKIITFSALLHQ
jgi:hypothetical protein